MTDMKTPSRKASPVSTSQKVENFIRSAIYEGRLKPRERLIEDDIAKQLGCSRGPLREAVLRLERGDFGFVDSDKLLMKGSQRLACEMTLMGGNVMWDLNGRASEPWEKPAPQTKK